MVDYSEVWVDGVWQGRFCYFGMAQALCYRARAEKLEYRWVYIDHDGLEKELRPY